MEVSIVNLSKFITPNRMKEFSIRKVGNVRPSEAKAYVNESKKFIVLSSDKNYLMKAQKELKNPTTELSEYNDVEVIIE